MAKLTREVKLEALIDKMVDEADRTLDDMNSEMIYTTKTGIAVPRTKPLPSDRKDLSVVFGTLYAKIQLATGKATSRSEVTTPDQFAAYLLGAREAFEQTKADSASNQ